MTADRAHARSTDPQTSHEAADAITPHVPILRQRVHIYAHARGSMGFCDAQMETEIDEPGSSLRTRRAELTERNIILDSGRTMKFGDSPRERIVWVHRDFVDNPPPILRAKQAPAQPDHLKEQAKVTALVLDGFAVSLNKEGRSALARELTATADLLRQLAV